MDRTSDTPFIMAMSRMPAINDEFDVNLLLDAGAWAPGERLRQVAPLAALLAYAAHPSGLRTLSFTGDPVTYWLEDGTGYHGNIGILQTLLGALIAALRLDATIRAAAAAGKDVRELEVACRAGFSGEGRGGGMGPGRSAGPRRAVGGWRGDTN